MAKFACVFACILLVTVSAERTSSSSGGSRDSDFGFDSDTRNTGSSGAGARPGSANSNRGNFPVTGSKWDSDDDDAGNDIPKITAWKGGVVPYEIAPEISSSNANALRRMFQDISDKTCVTFRPKRSSDSNYVMIKSGSTCSAPLGMTTGSSGSRFSTGAASNVILGQSCFTTKRVGRRIINLLGIPHETSRPDRDQFVEINMRNLRTGYDKNIKQIAASAYLTGVLDVPYDVNSITQYSDEDLAKDPSTWAIRPKKRGVTDLGGNVFSSADFEKIRKAYNCPSSSSSGGRFSSGRN